MKKKFKQMPLVLGGLAAIALGTVGFSAWVITGATAEQKTGNITIQAAAVEDRRMTMTIDNVDSKVVFACTNEKDGVIQNDSESEVEDLDFGFTVHVTNALNDNSGFTKNSWFNGLKVTMAVTAGETEYNQCITDNLFVSPLAKAEDYDTFSASLNTTSDPISYTATNSNGQLDVAFKFNFKWGTAFAGQNPGTWDGTQFAGASNSTGALTKTDDIRDKLLQLYGLNNTAKYEVTVSMLPAPVLMS